MIARNNVFANSHDKSVACTDYWRSSLLVIMTENVSYPTRIQRQDTGLCMNTTKSPLNLFPQISDCVYTSNYCEENVWHLCQSVSKSHPSELQHCKVVFISNDQRKVPLWKQKCGHDEDKLVFWDYHVIFLYKPDDRCLVYDQDSELPFPTYFHKYVTETFRTDHILKPEYFRFFRVIPASTYLQHFASDRRHMRRPDGSWFKPPPDYPPINTDSSVHNLEDFINMDPTRGVGDVMNLTQLVQTFYQIS